MSHIYVVEFGDSTLIKVGYTSNPTKRLADHARQGRIFYGTECRTWLSIDHPRASKNERRLIAWCADRDQSGDGEYFRLPFDSVVAFASSLDFSPLSDEEITANAERAAEFDRFRDELFSLRPALSRDELRAVIEPDDAGIWRVRADDAADADRIVRLDTNMGLPHANLELVDCDGMASPASARLLAYRLLLSADYAERTVVTEVER